MPFLSRPRKLYGSDLPKEIESAKSISPRALEGIAASRAKRPSWSDVASIVGSEAVERGRKKGNVKVDLTDRKKRNAYRDLMTPYMRAESDRFCENNNWISRVKVRKPNAEVGEGGVLVVNGVSTGHTHMGEPYPWQRRNCPGCRRG